MQIVSYIEKKTSRLMAEQLAHKMEQGMEQGK
jgi:hypothetical protein